MKIRFLLRAAAGLALVQCSASALARDPLSYARPEQVKISALHLDLKADFARRILSGHADLSLDWVDGKARSLDLDSRGLAIAGIEGQDADGRWRKLAYTLDPPDPEKGRALHVAALGQPGKVRIWYHTAPDAPALQWLKPAQTLSGKRPFMFSQSETVDARSWVPLQDTPSVRFTYTARIEAPRGLTVVMSAANQPSATGKGSWRFAMPQPIPSYLLAIAIGELHARRLGARTGVYAEPQRLRSAAWEFAETEKMIEAAERLYGPYRWGRYDMLVLPPSFPIGGMENPRMTFVTPTMIAGDRSLVGLVAHELAHSWSGNLVTNASWKHWWLNEGFTTYVASRIVEAIYGQQAALENLQLEQEEALALLATLPKEKQALLTRDPDTSPDHYTDQALAYAKGAWFLRTLEQRAGRATFDPFLRGWFDSHAFQSVTTADFVRYLRGNLLDQHPEVMTDAELNEWLYGPGIPASAQRAASPRLAALDATRAAWLKGDVATAELGPDWNAAEWMKFLNDIDRTATCAQLQAIDRAFHLSATGNGEVAFRFYRAAVHAGDRDIRPRLEAFLLRVGRQKFVVPLYAALRARPQDRAWAAAVYRKARARYHPETQASVDRELSR